MGDPPVAGRQSQRHPAQENDEWYPATLSDRAALDLLVELADGRPILELGVGTGRLACELARRGQTVWRVDNSSAMIERLRGRPGGDRVRAVIGDMAELDLPPDAPPFGLAYAAFNTVFCLGSLEEQARCFARVGQVVGRTGRLVVEAFVAPSGASGNGPVEVTYIGETAVVLRVSTWAENGAAVFGHHIEITEYGNRLRPWRMRPLTVGQLDDLARAASFELENRFGDWD